MNAEPYRGDVDWPARPIEQCYWVEPRRLLAGQYPGDINPGKAREKIRALLAAGMDVFIDLTEEGERSYPYEAALFEEAGRAGIRVTHQRFGIQDVGVPSVELMADILDAIDGALHEGHTVYLHCWGGIGRAGTAVGAWLVRRGYTAEAAFAFIRQGLSGTPRMDRESPETHEQRELVRHWREGR